jgi:hypothetical protein
MLKGIVSQDLEQIQWIPSDDTKSLGLPEHIFNSFRCHFHALIQKSMF